MFASTTTNSIVDVLRSKGLPTTVDFRGQLYQSLGLGTADAFKQDAVTTGSVNTQLLKFLNDRPDVLDKMAGALSSGGVDFSKLDAQPKTPDQAVTGTAPVQAQPSAIEDINSGTTLPDTVDQINQLQREYIAKRTKRDEAVTAFENIQAPTLADIISETNQIRSSLGITDLENEYNSLIQAYSGTEQDIRDESARSGGIVTESRMQELVAERTAKLQPRINTLATQLASREAMAQTIQDQLKTSRSDAERRVTQLIGLYEGDTDRAYAELKSRYDAIDEYFKEAKDERQKILELSLKYPNSGINASTDTLDSAYGKASLEAKTTNELKDVLKDLSYQKSLIAYQKAGLDLEKAMQKATNDQLNVDYYVSQGMGGTLDIANDVPDSLKGIVQFNARATLDALAQRTPQDATDVYAKMNLARTLNAPIAVSYDDVLADYQASVLSGGESVGTVKNAWKNSGDIITNSDQAMKWVTEIDDEIGTPSTWQQIMSGLFSGGDASARASFSNTLSTPSFSSLSAPGGAQGTNPVQTLGAPFSSLVTPFLPK